VIVASETEHTAECAQALERAEAAGLMSACVCGAGVSWVERYLHDEPGIILEEALSRLERLELSDEGHTEALDEWIAALTAAKGMP
jgi:hypothetical protein